jgi:hypothetical protein
MIHISKALIIQAHWLGFARRLTITDKRYSLLRHGINNCHKKFFLEMSFFYKLYLLLNITL